MRTAVGTRPARLALMLLAALAWASAVHSAEDRLSAGVRFDIPAQSLEMALLQFSEQARMQIVVANDIARGLMSPALQGQYSAEEALGVLLEGTGLTYRMTDERTIAISAGRTKRQASGERTSHVDSQAAIARGVLLAEAPQQRPVPQAQQTEGAGRTAGDALALEEIVVIGTPGGQGIRKLDASFAITTLSEIEIQRLAPESTADLFSTVPGVWVESSGGESGANIFVRGFPASGDAEFVTVQLDGAPIYPPPTLAFLENSTLFRVDETVERMEALRGGPNPVLSNGQPGVTFNFIQKKGAAEPEGIIRLTGSDRGMKRIDLFSSGPVADDLFYSVGGFYRAYEGIRDTQFTGERGGQISGTLRKVMERGELTVYGRYVNDRNAWLVPIPINSTDTGNLSEFPGFDAGTGTYHGNDTRSAVLEIGRNGETVTRDLADGRGPNIALAGATLDYDLGGGWTLNDRFIVTTGEADTRGLVGAAPPQTATSFLTQVDTAAVGGTFTFAATGAVIADPNQPLMQLGWWSVDKDIQSFSNDGSLTKEIFRGNTLTAGVYFADFSSKDLWYLGNNQLVTAESHGRRVNLLLNDGTQVTRGGFLGASFFAVNASFDGQSIAGYLFDEWQVTGNLRVDAGVRWEDYGVDATLENVSFGVDLDGDPATLFNNGAAVLNGSFSTLSFDESEISWTAGANYSINDALGIYARANRGNKFPQFNELQNGARNLKKIEQYELGLKASTEYLGVFATFFYNDFVGLPFSRFDQGQLVTIIGDSSAHGIEVETVIQPIEPLRLALSGTWQDAKFDNFGASSGKRIARQPELQLRFAPSFDFIFSGGTATAYGAATYVGDRFADPENLQPTPSYTRYDLGVIVDLSSGLNLQVSGDNVTDELALTEGNPQIIGAQTGTIFARPILGRSVKFSVGYRF